MSDKTLEELLDAVQEYAIADYSYPIPETRLALETAREILLAHVEELERIAAHTAWYEGFDEASDDLGRGATMDSFGEVHNPYRGEGA